MPDTARLKLLQELGAFHDDPLGYAMYAFPWDSEPSIQVVKLPEKYKNRFDCAYGPDLWACEFLDQLGQEIKKRNFDGKNAVMPVRFSTVSGHGIGKTVLVALLIKFILDTRPRSKGVVTASTAPQLQSKTWAELGKWHRLSLSRGLFSYSSGRDSMRLKSVIDPEGWNVMGQTCKEENADSFQGLHASTSTAFYIFDEASGIPDAIYTAREGGLTDGEPMVFDFGNPVRNTGTFFENSAGRNKGRYVVRNIDSRTVAITNKALLDEWKDDMGEDSDFFKVRVRGVFPSSGSAQFIQNADVEASMGRAAGYDNRAPLVIGVDVARFGDNYSSIYARLGMDAKSFPFRTYQGLDAVQLADRVIQYVEEFREKGIEYSAIFVDTTGVGGPVRDILHHAGYTTFMVDFGRASPDPAYRLVSDMIWGRMRDAIKNGLALPDRKTDQGAKLYAQLTQRLYGYTLSNKIRLESKSEMTGRMESPDEADSLAVTFFTTIAPLERDRGRDQTPAANCFDYNPMDFQFH